MADLGRRRSVANKLSQEFLPKGRIKKLKQFFEERTQPTSIFKFSSDRLEDFLLCGVAYDFFNNYYDSYYLFRGTFRSFGLSCELKKLNLVILLLVY